MTFLRAFSYLLAPGFFLSVAVTGIVDLRIGLLPIFLIVLVLCAVVAALVVWFSEKAGSVASIIYTGSRQPSHKDRFSSNISRARYLKTKEAFSEALAVIDEYLHNVSDDPEGLFLKAQILIASDGDNVLARRCLLSILKQTPQDDTYHRWAKELMVRST